MEKVIYTVEEVGALLGLSLPKSYELIHSKDGPPSIKIGRCIRIPRDGFMAWLEQQSEKGARV